MSEIPRTESVSQVPTPAYIWLDNGERRKGWHEAWRHLLVWKELAESSDLDEWGQPEEWYWAHAHESELHWEPIDG